MEHVQLNDLETFVRVVESGSFTAAADQLAVPKSTVSRRVSRLEEALGVKLLARKPRSFTVTPDGRRLHARVAPALREIIEAQDQLAGAHQSLSGSLRLTAPHDVGTSAPFARLLAEFGTRHPDVVPHVELTMRAVDILEEDFDVAFRLHRPGGLSDLPGVVMRSVSDLRASIFAAPVYLREHGVPKNPGDLNAHRWVGFSVRPESMGLRHEVTGESAELSAPPALVVNDFSLSCAVLREGAGLGLAPHFVACAFVARGELVPVLPKWTVAGARLSILWPATRHLSPRVRALIDHAVSRLPPLMQEVPPSG